MKKTQAEKMLIIVDPQIDFISGSLAVAKGAEAMDQLTAAIGKGQLDNYTQIVVTQDFHPANHCSFTEQGGVFPAHCVQETEGFKVYPALYEALKTTNSSKVVYLTKGDNASKEEFSIFQNEANAARLKTMIEKGKFTEIDICGIASDYCVYETLKDLLAFYPASQVKVVDNCIASVADDAKLVDFMNEKGVKTIQF